MSLSPLVGFSCRSLSTVLPVPLLSPDEFPLFLAGRLDHVDQFGFQLADLTVDGEQDSALVLASAGVVGIPGGIAVVIIGGSGTGIGGAVRPAAASGSRRRHRPWRLTARPHRRWLLSGFLRCRYRSAPPYRCPPYRSH